MMEDCKVIRPRSVEEALAALSAVTGALPIAGGTDLLVKMKDGHVRPRALVAVDHLPELRVIEVRDGMLWIGGGATHAQLMASSLVKEHAPLLAAACATVGAPQIRNRGTIAGNVVTSSPAGDTIPALIALDAEVYMRRNGGQRRMPVERFFVGPGRTKLAAEELVAGFAVPLRTEAGPERRWAYRKLGQRKAMSIAIVDVAVRLDVVNGRIAAARVVLGSVAPTVRRAAELEKALIGPVPDDARLRELAPLAREAARPISDVRASAEYRLNMVEAVTYQALYVALHREELESRGQRVQALEPVADDTGECCRRAGAASAAATAAGHAHTAYAPGAAPGCGRRELTAPEGTGEGECDGAGEGRTIRVRITFHSQLGDHAPGSQAELTLLGGATLGQLHEHLGLAGDTYIVALVNGKREFDDRVLRDGDGIDLLRPVGGG